MVPTLRPRLVAAALTCLLASAGASAATLYQQLPDAAGLSQQSDTSNGTPHPQTIPALGSITLETISWWGFHGQNSNGSAFDNLEVFVGGAQQTGLAYQGAANQNAQFNATNEMNNGQYNAGLLQQANLVNAGAQNTANLANAAGTAQMGQFNASNQQQMALANQAAANQGAQFNAANANQTDQFNAGLLAQNSQFNAANANQAGQFNAGQEQAAALANQQAGLQGAGLNLQGGAALSGLSNQELSQAIQRAGLVGGVGDAQQANAQQMLDALYAQYGAAQNWPIQMQQLLNQSLGLLGNPTLTNQQSTGSQRSSGFNIAFTSGGGGSSGASGTYGG